MASSSCILFLKKMLISGKEWFANIRTLGRNVILSKKLVYWKPSLRGETCGGKRLQDMKICEYRGWVIFSLRALLRDREGKRFVSVLWFKKKKKVYFSISPMQEKKTKCKISKMVAKFNYCFPASSGPERFWREKFPVKQERCDPAPAP